jgi:hypothetical protein
MKQKIVDADLPELFQAVFIMAFFVLLYIVDWRNMYNLDMTTCQSHFVIFLAVILN